MRSINVPGVGPIQFPDSMSDDQIIQAIERDILPGVRGRTQVAPAQVTEPPAPAPERGFFGSVASMAGDTGASLVTGAGSALSGIGGLGGVAGLGYDNMLSRAGRSVSEFGEGLMSPELVEKRQALSRAIQDAESRGLVGEASAALSALASNPSLLFSMAIEQIPAFVLSGGVGRGASAIGQVAARRAAIGGGEAAEQAILQAGQRAGQVAAVGTAAGLQGGGVAEETYQDLMRLPGETLQRSSAYQELLRTMSPDEARSTLADRAAREAGLLAGGISVGTMSVMPSAERAMFSRGVSQSAIRRALGVGTGEAVSEGIEEGGGRFAQNLAIQRRADEERSLTQGVGGAAATGAVLGGIMGGGIGAIQRPPMAPSTDPGAGNLPPDLRAAIEEYVANRDPVELTDGVRLVTENLPVTAEQFLGAAPEAQERLIARAQREFERQTSGENLPVLDPQGNRDPETANIRVPQSASRPSDELISGQAGSRAEAFQFEEGRGERMEGGMTQAEFFRQRAEELARKSRPVPGVALDEGALREARRTQFVDPGTSAERTVRAAQEVRAEQKPTSPFFPLVENFIEGHVRTYGDAEPISVPALQQYMKERTGRTVGLGQAQGILDTYYNASSQRGIPSGQGWVLQRDTVKQTGTTGEPSGVPGGRMPPKVTFGPGAQAQNVYRAVAPKGPNTDEAGRPVAPPRLSPSIPTDEYGFARPQRGVGGQTPQASARAAGAEQAAPEAEVEPSEAEGRLSRRVEAQNKINALYLDKLKGMGDQGRLIRNGLVDALKNRTLSAQQAYAAFTAADTLATLLPAGANHRIQFVEKLLPTKELAEAIARSGGDPTKELQGLRDRSSGVGMSGIITISLSPASNVMPYLTETAAHEAFHVLQDYYGKYDPQFAKLMSQSFRDGMMIGDVDPTIRRKLEQARYPGSSKSYWQVLTESLPNVIGDAKEAQAYVFASLMDASRRGVPMTGLKPAFARFVNFIKNFFSKLGSKLRGEGFQTAEEVLGRSVSQGGRRFDQMAAPTDRDFAASGSQASARNAPPFIRSARQLLDDARQTSSWRDWYERHEGQVKDLFGDDAPLFQQILSATSQAASVPANVSLALKAYEQLLSGRPFTGYLPAVIKNLDRIRAEEALRGQKISQYGKANKGGAEAASGVAVDRHIAQLMFGTDKPTKQMVQKATSAIQSIARLLGWQPREVQAALWAFNQIRKGVDPGNVKSYDFYLARKQEDIRALRSAFTSGEGRGVQAGAAASVRIGEADPAAEEDLADERAETGGRGADQAVAKEDADQPVAEPDKLEVQTEKLVQQASSALQKAGRNVQASARGDVVTDFDLVQASGTRAKASYVFAADLKSGGYLRIDATVDDRIVSIDSISALQIQKNPYQYDTEGFGGYSKGVRLSHAGVRDMMRRLVETLKKNHPTISEISGVRATGARMRAARAEGREGQTDRLKAAVRAPQLSARSPLASDPAAAAIRDKLTGKEYDRPGIFSDALRRFTGALPGEKNSSALVRTAVNRAAPGWMLDRLVKEKGLSMRSVGLALEVALNNSGRVQMYLDHGPLAYDPKTGDVKVREDVPGLITAIKGRLKIADKREAQSYLVALRERDLRKSGKKGFFNLTDAEINQIISKSEAAHPEWKQMAADIQRINKALLDFAVATGTLDRSKADQLASMFYTPFYRQADEDAQKNANEVVGPRLSDSLTRVKTAFDVSLKGGKNPLGDLFENMIRNADVVMKAGMKNVAMRQAAEALEAVGLGRPAKQRETGKTITYRVDGQDKNFEVDDPVLYTALAGAPRHVTNGIYQTMATFAGFFRDMITIAPSFMLANLWRGKIMAYVQEGVPLYANTFDGLRQALQSSTSYKAIAAQTGFGGYTYGMGERDAAAAFEREIGGLGYGPKGLLRRTYDALQKASEATEMAERIKLYERAKAQGMTDKEAAFQAYLLAPFSRRGMGGGWAGETVNFLVPLVPFLNAKIQGMYRLIENEKGDTQKLWTLGIPKQMLLRGLVVMAASLALAAKNMADEPDRWDKENPDMKFRYDIIYLPNERRILLPRAFEVGSVFGALPVFILDAIRREDSRDLSKALTDLGMSTFFFNPIPAAAVPLLGAATNYDFFRARALETAGDQSKLPEERVNRSTSAIARIIGEQAGVSPIRVQYVLEGYSGTIGATVLAGLDSIWASMGLIPSKPAGAFGDPMSMPAIIAGLTGANRFYRSDDQTASRFVGDFYKIKEMTDQLIRSQNDATESRDLDRLAELRGDAGLPLRLRPMVNQASTQITEINRRMARIERGDLDSVSKADALRPLRERRDMVAQRVVERARQIGAY